MPSILLLSNRIPHPLHDGGALAMDAMIRGYHVAGWTVYVLAMNTSRHRVPQEILAGLYPEIKGFYAVDVDNAVSTKGMLKNLLFSREPEHASRFNSKAFADQLRTLLQTLQPDVIQLESPFLAAYLPLIREETKAIVVHRMHNVEGQIWSRLASASSGMKRFYLQVLAKRISRHEQSLWRDADLLLPITEADAAAVKAIGIQTPIQVAAFGIPTSGNQQELPGGVFKVYHIGAMDWLPNAEGIQWFLKEVWPKVHENSPELSFHFAGRAMPESFYNDLPKGAVCEGAVADALDFILDKHVLVVPLRSGGGIRIKILEALSQGKLVISTDIGMQGIEAQSDLHYLKANTAPDFIHLIGWAGEHPDKAAAIGRSGQRLIRERYDAAAIMSLVVEKLEEMLVSSDSTSSRLK